jgi:hypothetical protein
MRAGAAGGEQGRRPQDSGDDVEYVAGQRIWSSVVSRSGDAHRPGRRRSERPASRTWGGPPATLGEADEGWAAAHEEAGGRLGRSGGHVQEAGGAGAAARGRFAMDGCGEEIGNEGVGGFFLHALSWA